MTYKLRNVLTVQKIIILSPPQYAGGCGYSFSWPSGSSQMSLLAGQYKSKALYSSISVKQRLSLSLRLMFPGLSSASVISKNLQQGILSPICTPETWHWHQLLKMLIIIIFIGVSDTSFIFLSRAITILLAVRITDVWYVQIGCAVVVSEPWFIAVCLSGQSTGWWQMTLLGELHGHSLELGLSISHLTRPISMENVCEHPLDPFLLFLYVQCQNVRYSSPTP